MKKKFKCEVGLSDHSIGITAPIVSVVLGATVIEKHFKIDDKGFDNNYNCSKILSQNLSFFSLSYVKEVPC